MVSSYEILASIAQGGMAEVFLVCRRAIGGFERRLAMKMMHPHLAGDAGFVNMFLDEARIASCIDHPNVVKVLDVGSHAGLPWLVMEWLDGKSLAEVLMSVHRLSIPLRVNVLAEVATGLHAAHEARGADGAPLGVVHRDVSPQNVHVGYDGVVKLVDFGIAAARGRLTRTDTGQVKGKVGYLAPEQLLFPNEPVRRGVDVWAFGVMAWETLSVRRLFGGTDAGTKMYQIVHAELPSLRDVAPEVPEEIAALVMQCLERDPARRPADMSEVARALKGLAGDPHAREAIAAHMTSAFREERRALEMQLESFRQTPSGERPNPTRTSLEDANTKADLVVEPAPIAPAPTPAPPRRWWPVVALLSLLLSLGAAGLIYGGWLSQPDARATRGATVAEAPPDLAPSIEPSSREPTTEPSLGEPTHVDVVPSAPVEPRGVVSLSPPPTRTITVRVARGLRVFVGEVEHDERPLRLELPEGDGVRVLLRARDGRQGTRTLDANDEGMLLELPRRSRTEEPIWGSPY